MANDQVKALSSEATRLYNRVRRQWAIRDEPGLTILLTGMQALDRLRQAQATLAAQGIIRPDRFGQDKPHPAMQVEKEARAGLLLALKALALDLETLDK
ncbi:MAG: hypothetical protein AAB654_00850 [Acidobacteriota bacterium]